MIQSVNHYFHAKTQNRKEDTKKGGNTGSRRQEDMIAKLDQKTCVLVGTGERHEPPRDIVIADQIEKHCVYRAFTANHNVHLLPEFWTTFRAFLPDNAKLKRISYQLSI